MPRRTPGTDNRVLRVCRLLNRHRVRYLIAGGVAGNLHGSVRATNDVDVLVPRDVRNAARLLEALAELPYGLARELDAFSDLAHRVVSYVEQGDAFADEWVFVGTHTGPVVLPDGTEVPPTGKRVEMPGMELVRIRDGKIVVDNLYYDNLAVLAQLGLMQQGVPITA